MQAEARKGAVAPGFMYEFPWECVGNYKYALYAPFVYVVATGQDDADMWCYHMCGIVSLRYLQVARFSLVLLPFPVFPVYVVSHRSLPTDAMTRK